MKRLEWTGVLAISGMVLTVAGPLAPDAAAATTTGTLQATPAAVQLNPTPLDPAPPTATPPNPTPPTIFSATADSWVDSGAATTNYGSSDLLQLSRNSAHGLVRFNLSSLPAGSTVLSATLELYSNQTANGSFVVSPEADDWTENTVSAADQPVSNATVLATSTTLQANAYASAELPTSSIPTGGDVDFGLSTTLDLPASVASRESTHAPQLIISYGSSTLPPPSPTTDITSPTTAASPASAPVDPSGQAMPKGDLPGWHQIFSDDFNVPVALGKFPGADTKWAKGYADGTPDTAGKTNGGKSVYYPDKVLSIGGGMLDMYLHSAGGFSMGAAPTPVTMSGWPYNKQLYGRYTARFRSDPVHGFKTAWLLWPDSGLWKDGEVDFPEGGLGGPISAYSHCAGDPMRNCVWVTTDSYFSAWHTATTEWSPGRIAFYLDGKLIGSSTTGVPTKPMHYLLQSESCSTGCPPANEAGHLQIDWVVIYSYKP